MQFSPTRQLVSHDDNIAPTVLTTHNNATETFWNQKYGGNSYMGGRQFKQQVGNAQYDGMKIYDPRPPWKVGPVLAGAVIVVLVAVALITGRYVTELIIGSLILAAFAFW